LLKHPTLDQLHALGLNGMAKAFVEIAANGEADGLGHHEWLGLLLDREASWRQDKRFAARLRVAKLRQQASVEDVDYRCHRGLDRTLFQKLVEGEWINAHDNLALVGPTGVGKSWLASALGHKACRDNRSVLYQRVPACSRTSPWRAVMDAILASCAISAEPTFSSSMIGGLSRSTPPRAMISWKSSKSATDAAPQ
jgi:DNA replication protein DnaC